MALTYTGTGGLFTRLGKVLGETQRVVSGYGYALNTGVEGVWDQFPNSDEDGTAVDGLLAARDNYRTVHTSYTTALSTVARNTVIEQVHRQAGPLPTKTLAAALTELKAQMVTDGDTIKRPTTAATVTAWGSNKGTGVVNVSLTNEFGDPLDMVFAENLKATVTNDVSTGGTRYSEAIVVTGAPAKATTDYKWTLEGGSGASKSLSFVDAETAGLLTDGGFESWGGTGNNTPTYWSIVTGTAGTHILRESSNIIRSNYAMRMTSDGSTLVAFKQALASTVKTNTVYALNLWAKMSATDASGQLRIRLCDSGGTTLTDDAGTSLSKTVGMNGGSGIAASFTNVSAFFSTPRQLPTTTYLEVAITTSPSSGKSVYIDQLGFAAATQLYNGGPFCAAFSKDTANAKGDYYTIAVTNSLVYNSFVRGLDRLFGMRDLGIYLPSDASSNTINDSLIS